MWNGHFPESENIFQRPKFAEKNPEIPQSDFCQISGSEPEKLQFHTPGRSIPPLARVWRRKKSAVFQDSLLVSAVLSQGAESRNR